jgi:hypothetical protein
VRLHQRSPRSQSSIVHISAYSARSAFKSSPRPPSRST